MPTPAPLSAKLLKNGTLKTYQGFPHGMPTTEAETINADLLAFIKGRQGANHQPEFKMGLIFKHDFHDEFGSWPLAYTPYGCMDFGEILSVARAVGEWRR